ncbi:MAG TPA: hypothetical protein VHW25_05170 [Steroidobacteraceae bacterium]|nr:hypothetical protein [Steroidobacteraceae bacterium]
MAMGIAAGASAAGKGTGAISRGVPGDDGPIATAKASAVVTGAAAGGWGAAATATDETAALDAGLRTVIGASGFGAGFIADAVAAVALYSRADCGVRASMTAGLAPAAAGSGGVAGLRSLA